jgi:hypothetical protein
LGKRPDFMYLFKHEDKLFELIFGESSRLVCTKNKIKDDEVKLMREVNDGLTLVRKKYQTENEKFSIIGIQIAGNVSFFILFIIV